MAREIADDKSRSEKVRITAVRHLINGSILVGGGVATSLSLLTFFQRQSVMQGLTSDPSVRAASLAIFPAVLATQGQFILFVFYYYLVLTCYVFFVYDNIINRKSTNNFIVV